MAIIARPMITVLTDFKRSAVAVGIIIGCAHAVAVAAQERPLDTRDPAPIGAGEMLVAAGGSYERGMFYPLSGLTGDLFEAPLLRLTVGLSPIADVQLTGGPYERLSISKSVPAPLSAQATAHAGSAHDVVDMVIGTKIRFVREEGWRPDLGFSFSVRLPNAKHGSGLGQDTTDFSASLLAGRTVGAIRAIGNIGLTIMSAPLNPGQQNDVMTYGAALSATVGGNAALVAEVNGHISTRNGVPPVGTETRGTVQAGARYRIGTNWLDAAAFLGLTPIDPDFGITAGVTWHFRAFSIH